ncbi:MAG: hypothetical protein H7221_07445, partial [Flavobacterium sp.]|nr:hypothetical protein [Flavobacterium sp.]
MKNSKIKLLALAAVASIAFISCKSNTEQKQENLNEATEDVASAKQDVENAKD